MVSGHSELVSRADETPFDGKRILVTGATGLIGSALQRALTRAGAVVIGVSRSTPPERSNSLSWQPYAAEPFSRIDALEGLDAVVHLSGANVSGRRWTAAYKEEIVASRTVPTAALSRVLSRLRMPPKVLVAASAIGLYGDRGDEVLDESAAAGTGFLPETCLQWEAATGAAEAAGIRVVHMRFGVVLSPEGGALAKMLPLFRLGLGGRLGDGREWMSWITLEDTVRAVLHAIAAPELQGPLNCVAPAPVRNSVFTAALAKAVSRPAIFPAPAFALRLAFGEMADAALLASCRAVPARLVASGFRFEHPETGPALIAVLKG